MKITLSIALVALVALVALAESADAAAAQIVPVSSAALDPNCATPVPACAPCAPTIIYVHHGCLPCGCSRCEPPIQTALEVKIPCGCTCTTTLIPVCLPACCTGAPQVTCHWGACGRGVVRYDYCCGVSVKIIIRRTGDFVVHYIHA